MNLKIVTIDRLKEFLNKFSKVATSGNYSDLSGVPTKVSQFTNDIGYAKTTDIPTVTTYTAGEGIKIENGVISINNNKIGNPTCPGYTLYGDYFLSDTVITNENWDDAYNATKTVIVTQNYLLGPQSITATARTLSKEELSTLTAEQRKINNRWYWTSTLLSSSYAYIVRNDGNFSNGYGNNNQVNYSHDDGGERLGFKNPFI